MDKIVEVHEADSDAVVQAGVQWDALNEELLERGMKLFFPLDPSSPCVHHGISCLFCTGE